jgi:hypothetical protein
MFEAHGWATTRLSADGGAEGEATQYPDLRSEIEKVVGAAANVVARFDADLNGSAILTVSASKNHRYEGVIDLFRWVAQHYPGSYGLLYVHDAEDARGFDNDFRVWRLARGRITELADPFLSPLIATIEDP